MIYQAKIHGEQVDIASVGLTMRSVGPCRLCGKNADYRLDIVGVEPLGICKSCLHCGGFFYSMYALIYKYFDIPEKYQRKPGN